MSLSYDVLGEPGQDNALMVRVDSGQGVNRVLFDCGDCLDGLEFKEIQTIDHLLFSHLHMDHVAGFDAFFRCTYDRGNRDNHIWGPVGSAAILHHRFRGFLWNLAPEMTGTWRVHEYDGAAAKTWRFELREGFETAHFEGETQVAGALVSNALYEINACVMEHRGPCLAYQLVERPRENVRVDRLQELGLSPGKWLGDLQSGKLEQLDVDGRMLSADELKELLVETTPGARIAYLTDFRLQEDEIEWLGERLSGTEIVVCEGQYRNGDHDLAKKHDHMTAGLVGKLACRIGAGEMILFHLSERYSPAEWIELLNEVKEHSPRARFPEHWRF